jgi:RNA polymerase sigma-70 factor, ECF subfamily
VSSDFYATSIVPFAPIIIKICRAYTNTQEDFEDYYQEVCLQIWRSHRTFGERAAWSTWIYRVSLNVCMTLLKTQKRNRRIFASENVPPELVEDSRAFADESLNRKSSSAVSHFHSGISSLSEQSKSGATVQGS